jgi:tetratricopeptide (TPR) repeat protein
LRIVLNSIRPMSFQQSFTAPPASPARRLLLTATQAVRSDAEGADFLLRRLTDDISRARPFERVFLRRLALAMAEGAWDRLPAGLVEYACALERRCALGDASALLALAVELRPYDAATHLHAGRLARMTGDGERALAHYAAARACDGTDGHLARLARIGEATLAPDPERALGRAIRAAQEADDDEAAAVGLEWRATVRRRAGRHRAAGRDLCLAALRFSDAVDRGRVAHVLADIALAVGDVDAGREALLAALEAGERDQTDRARTRLHLLARDLGDELALRRWQPSRPTPLVSLGGGGRAVADAPTAAPMLRDWRAALAPA